MTRISLFGDLSSERTTKKFKLNRRVANHNTISQQSNGMVGRRKSRQRVVST